MQGSKRFSKVPSKKTADLQVFATGASYGFMATTYKLAYANSLSWQQVVALMCWCGSPYLL